ncbi:MAG: hypothetical protein HWN65_08450 [Candidatus Helarchaeota archaeon]|nr:hypothetical protein [Candidatus Helarchaeota archaeon]
MGFLENIAGFLFRPHDQCQKVLAEEKTNWRFTKTFLFVLYSTLILGIVCIFWILYPERVYYGVPLDASLKMLFRISVSEPILFLLILGVIFGLIVILHFLTIGTFNYIIGGVLSKKRRVFKGKDYRNYLSIYGISSTLPLLLLGVFTIFWVYFFEKLNFTTESPPFFDWTLLNTIFFSVLFGFLAWKWICGIRINQAFFDISLIRATIPILGQLATFYGFLMVAGYIGSLLSGELIGVV